MSIVQKTFRSLLKMREMYLQRVTYKAEIRNIERKKKLYSSVELSDKQETEIKQYWKSISGLDIDTRWHRLYQSYMGIYNKKYFPEILYTTKLEKRLSPPKYYGILSDKGLITSIFPGEPNKYRHPKTFIYNCNGVYTNGDRKVISEQEAVETVFNAGNAIIKPTIDTSSGEGVLKLDIKDGIDQRTGNNIKDILSTYKRNFIMQECVKQSKLLSGISPNALNTFRIITYIVNGKVYHAPLSMRIGTGSSFVDNIHAGGLCIGITEQYNLRKYAFTEMGDRFDSHPDTKIVFDGYHIEPLKRVIAVAKELHGFIPQIKMISWDWSLDENDIPVLIEINISGQSLWFAQMLNGEAFFGENTEHFAKMLRQ